MPDEPEEAQRWPHSEMETAYFDSRPSYVERCEVIIRGQALTISHQDGDRGVAVLRGTEVEPGHYTLHTADGGSMTLHRFAGGPRLECGWAERGERGMWTITLSDDPEDG